MASAQNHAAIRRQRVPERNLFIARRFREAADLIERLGDDNPFRTAAYRRGARVVERLTRDVGEIYRQEGEPGLKKLRAIGASLATTIVELLDTGRWEMLEGLRDRGTPYRTFEGIPGIGPDLAKRLYETLEVESLEALQVAAEQGKLERVPGIGPQRSRALRLMLVGLLMNPPMRDDGGKIAPAIDLLLAIDVIYRSRAGHGELPKVAPRRFNPKGESWLPIMNLTRGGYRFLVRYSNTARAHSLQTTLDWVVIDYVNDEGKGQCTVVTETRGGLQGHRVVRGREPDCHDYYEEARAPVGP